MMIESKMFHTSKKESIRAVLIFSVIINANDQKAKCSTSLDCPVILPEDIDSINLKALIPNPTTTTSSTPSNKSHKSAIQQNKISDSPNPENPDTLTPVSLTPEWKKMNPTCYTWDPSTYFMYKPDDMNDNEELAVYIVRGVLITCLAMFGITANIIAMLIFSWPGMMNPTTFILRGKCIEIICRNH